MLKKLGLLILSLIVQSIQAKTLTFSLFDNSKECFYDELKLSNKIFFEFQVITGGNTDVDVVLKNPSGQILYKQEKEEYDQIELEVEEAGVYEFCFSNEFSSFSRKMIYMEWVIDNDLEHELTALENQSGSQTLTTIESNLAEIHSNLKKSIDYQTHHRLREAKGRIRAEEISFQVQIWSFGQLVLLVCVCLGTTFLLRSFFSNRKSITTASQRR